MWTTSTSTNNDGQSVQIYGQPAQIYQGGQNSSLLKLHQMGSNIREQPKNVLDHRMSYNNMATNYVPFYHQQFQGSQNNLFLSCQVNMIGYFLFTMEVKINALILNYRCCFNHRSSSAIFEKIYTYSQTSHTKICEDAQC